MTIKKFVDREEKWQILALTERIRRRNAKSAVHEGALTWYQASLDSDGGFRQTESNLEGLEIVQGLQIPTLSFFAYLATSPKGIVPSCPR